MLHRAKPPNQGLWSPCGGKLETGSGESPHACAAREVYEEIGIQAGPTDFSLTGIISEHGYQGQAHWLMFLFELKIRLDRVPASIDEGEFTFVSRESLSALELPQTDREMIWPLFWRHRHGFFAAHCHCHSDGRNDWRIEQSLPPSAV